ncbi:MAG: hypothetical protein JNL66_24015 [Alphaproteobacteria bacterium]|nr:hypothetical protein [Alphaproteobacteria bacterium]
MQPDGTPGARPTQAFDFNSKIFGVPGAVFAKATDGAPSLKVKIGDLEASLPLPTVTASFDISGHDKDLLKLVAKGLKFAKEIRPGDSIPSEVLDGSASWAIDERHTEIARKRLTVQLVSWFKGRQTDIKDSDHLLRLADDPDVKERVNDAFKKAAESLGLPPTDKDGVLKRIELLVRELAYIEALRERFGKLFRFDGTLNTLQGYFRGDPGTTDAIMRIKALMRAPIKRFQTIFEQLDAMTSEVLSALKNVSGQIEFIRKSRDELWDHYMAWQDLLEEAAGLTIERSSACEVLVRKTYQLVAAKYPQEVTWR